MADMVRGGQSSRLSFTRCPVPGDWGPALLTGCHLGACLHFHPGGKGGGERLTGAKSLAHTVEAPVEAVGP